MTRYHDHTMTMLTIAYNTIQYNTTQNNTIQNTPLRTITSKYMQLHSTIYMQLHYNYITLTPLHTVT